jgi:diacylglycerol kinase
MAEPGKNYLRQRLLSFKYAFAGIASFIRTEPHARIHAGATAIVLALGLYCGLAPWKWATLLIVTAMVWIAEMLNTVIEKIMDHLSPEHHPRVKWIKDVAAGAVLVAVLIAIATGLIIFLPFFTTS